MVKPYEEYCVHRAGGVNVVVRGVTSGVDDVAVLAAVVEGAIVVEAIFAAFTSNACCLLGSSLLQRSLLMQSRTFWVYFQLFLGFATPPTMLRQLTQIKAGLCKVSDEC